MKELDFQNISAMALHEFACECVERYIPSFLLKEWGQGAIDTKRKWLNEEVSEHEMDELIQEVAAMLEKEDESLCSGLILETISALLEKDPLLCAKSTANKVIVTIGQYAYEKDGWRDATDAQGAIFRWQKERLDELRGVL